MREFFAHRLSYKLYEHTDENNPNILFHTGRLFQKYVVDAYVKCESNHLNYLRSSETQKTLRVDKYKGLMDFIQRESTEQNLAPGKVIILPSSFNVNNLINLFYEISNT